MNAANEIETQPAAKSGVFHGFTVTEQDVENSARYCEILRAQIEGKAKSTVSNSALRSTLLHAETRFAELRACLPPGAARNSGIARFRQNE